MEQIQQGLAYLDKTYGKDALTVGTNVYPSNKERNFDIGTVAVVGPRPAKLATVEHQTKGGGKLTFAGTDAEASSYLDKLFQQDRDAYYAAHIEPEVKELAANEVAVQWSGCGCGGSGPRTELTSDMTIAEQSIVDDYYMSDSVPEGHSRFAEGPEYLDDEEYDEDEDY